MKYHDALTTFHFCKKRKGKILMKRKNFIDEKLEDDFFLPSFGGFMLFRCTARDPDFKILGRTFEIFI